jgi:hypothetical protein
LLFVVAGLISRRAVITVLLALTEDGAEEVGEGTIVASTKADTATEHAEAVLDVGVSQGTADDDTADGTIGHTASSAEGLELTPAVAAVVSRVVIAAIDGNCGFISRDCVARIVDTRATAGTDGVASALAGAGVVVVDAVAGGGAELGLAKPHTRAVGEVLAVGNAVRVGVEQTALGKPVTRGASGKVEVVEGLEGAERLGLTGEEGREEGGGGSRRSGIGGGGVGVGTGSAMLARCASGALGVAAADTLVHVARAILSAGGALGAAAKAVVARDQGVQRASERLAGADLEHAGAIGAKTIAIEVICGNGDRSRGACHAGSLAIIGNVATLTCCAAVVLGLASVAVHGAATSAGRAADRVEEGGLGKVVGAEGKEGVGVGLLVAAAGKAALCVVALLEGAHVDRVNNRLQKRVLLESSKAIAVNGPKKALARHEGGTAQGKRDLHCMKR